jgi:polar amino acid transport system substrate-binding protein
MTYGVDLPQAVIERSLDRKKIVRLRFGFAILLAGACLLTGRPAAVQADNQPPAGILRVVAKPLEPFVIQQGGDLSGFSIDLWAAIAKDQGWEFQWVEVDTVTQQLNAVQQGQADVAIAGISITPEREQAVDFSYPYFRSGLQILVPMRNTNSLTNLVTVLFSPTLLKVFGFGLLILIVMAHLIWLIERGSKRSMPKKYLPGIWEASWWALSTLATHEYGDKKEPTKVYKRALAMVWVVLGIVLIAQFTAAVTASLTVDQLEGAIHGPADLPGKQIATVQGSTAAGYLDGIGIEYRPVSKIDDAYQLLETGAVDAVVYDAPILEYYAHTRGKGLVQVVGPIFLEETYGIALPTGSQLRKPIDESILRLMRNGTYNALYKKWFGENP